MSNREYKAWQAERQVAGAILDLIETSSMYELDDLTVTDTDGQEKNVWQTKAWRDLLVSDPKLAKQVAAEFPDWVPERMPPGVPEYRGEISEGRKRTIRTLVEARGRSGGKSDAEIENNVQRVIDNEGNSDEMQFLRANPEAQWAKALQVTVEELTVNRLPVIHAAYFRRIADMARRAIVYRQMAEESTDPAEKDRLYKLSLALVAPAKELARLFTHLMSTDGGRHHIASILGGKEKLDYINEALNYAGAGPVQSLGRSRSAA